MNLTEVCESLLRFHPLRLSRICWQYVSGRRGYVTMGHVAVWAGWCPSDSNTLILIGQDTMRGNFSYKGKKRVVWGKQVRGGDVVSSGVGFGQ